MVEDKLEGGGRWSTNSCANRSGSVSKSVLAMVKFGCYKFVMVVSVGS